MDWWHETVFYEIYIRSFQDSDGDGIGDLQGVIQKLSYLQKLGVTGIWLTPFYPSPKIDNGYDVSNYCDVGNEYGSLEDFEELIRQAHQVGIKVIIDVVFNHTSTEHPWFFESSSSKTNPKRDWYIWRDQPNNWESFFGGSAWQLDAKTNQYYYHSFAVEQADLNWQNPEVKQAIKEVIDFWVELGVDGFRLDVINNLSTSKNFTDNPYDENGNQRHLNDVNQIGILPTLEELKAHIQKKGKALFTVGEISSDKLPVIASYAGESLFDVTFNFNFGSLEKLDIEEIARQLNGMAEVYQDRLPTLFFNSHDMNRSWNRLAEEELAIYKMLVVLLLINRGVPFLFQGEELGVGDFIPTTYEMIRDVQALNEYQAILTKTQDASEALLAANRINRDKSRGMIPWPDATSGWIGLGRANPHALEIFEWYRQVLALRKQVLDPLASIEAINTVGKVLHYMIGKIMIVLNFGNQEVSLSLSHDFEVIFPVKPNCIPKNKVLKIPAKSCWIGKVMKNDKN